MSTPSPRTVKREYPVVPECYLGDGTTDIQALTLARQQRAREQIVAAEQIKMLAEKVKACYRKEGVNHYRKCEDVARAYMARVQRPTLLDGPVEASDAE